MKEKIIELIKEDIKEFDLEVSAIFVEEVSDQKDLNIELDSEKIIDLETITKASRIINKKLDESTLLGNDIDFVSIYSKEKGEKKNGS